MLFSADNAFNHQNLVVLEEDTVVAGFPHDKELADGI